MQEMLGQAKLTCRKCLGVFKDECTCAANRRAREGGVSVGPGETSRSEGIWPPNAGEPCCDVRVEPTIPVATGITSGESGERQGGPPYVCTFRSGSANKRVLAILALGPMRSREIVKALDLHKPSVQNAIYMLKSKGLITKRGMLYSVATTHTVDT